MNNRIEDVLVITGGLAPQLVTETLYAMAVNPGRRARDAFWPDRVIVAGTAANRRVFAERGLDKRVDDLCLIVRKPRPPLTLLTPLDAQGREIDDIRTDDDAEAFGTMVVALVQELTLNPDLRLHVSLAGGRKTMSFHAGVALSLYGRDQDKLSHVLLRPPETERAANFWHPTVDDLMLVLADGKPLCMPDGHQINAKNVGIDPANIPFFSVRHLLPRKLLKEPFQYSEVVSQVRMALGEEPVRVTLDPARCEVRVARLPPIKLDVPEFAFYQLLCEWAVAGHAGAGPEGEGGNHAGWLSDRIVGMPQDHSPNPVTRFVAILKDLRPDGSLKNDNLPIFERASDRSNGKTVNIKYFGELRSPLASVFKAHITNESVRNLVFRNGVGGRGTIRYGVDVPAMNIEILKR